MIKRSYNSDTTNILAFACAERAKVLEKDPRMPDA